MLCAFRDDPSSPGLTIDALDGPFESGRLRFVLRADSKDEFGNRASSRCTELGGVCFDGHHSSSSETTLTSLNSRRFAPVAVHVCAEV